MPWARLSGGGLHWVGRSPYLKHVSSLPGKEIFCSSVHLSMIGLWLNPTVVRERALLTCIQMCLVAQRTLPFQTLHVCVCACVRRLSAVGCPGGAPHPRLCLVTVPSASQGPWMRFLEARRAPARCVLRPGLRRGITVGGGAAFVTEASVSHPAVMQPRRPRPILSPPGTLTPSASRWWPEAAASSVRAARSVPVWVFLQSGGDGGLLIGATALVLLTPTLVRVV